MGLHWLVNVQVRYCELGYYSGARSWKHERFKVLYIQNFVYSIQTLFNLPYTALIIQLALWVNRLSYQAERRQLNFWEAVFTENFTDTG